MTAPPSPALLTTYFEQRDALRRFFQARLGGSADVEDLLQDLYLKVASLEATAEVREPRAYLYRLASNLMMDRWRSVRRSAARDAAWRDVAHVLGSAEDIDDAPSAEAVMASKQRLGRLLTALDNLPDRTRSIFRLHKFYERSYAEIAESLSVSKSTVEKHMMSALKVLAAKVGV
ncbi:RNA polymerase sigma factor [Brevundimonas sp. NIBR11]|uniref:RNA polymerase sigma factor n=1 Tax=Brevundimonas sp. NIBR11 TaxID=3015999 RepID=UPI0022F007D8|nr:RNA polymerase sigma factor [Brevundimonas sp. NIBR11]WGM31842.1 putative RNA polymerase sigma factor FecI [Brevundimonas sp. NIBR11]